ncbi:hypothetical protein [Pelosinus sp. UFO1]|uniref:hypothetical protein n=1 Tax=Pelosinus sp. UFO1 TaxID=484770 RepID=UPI0004D0F83A|nr:hypothetical protein [Pelosinus sp. UFO1]AIF51842.1 hypothetical protein UFO1_2295 [Pelosinus sp. UFO1]
MKLKIAEVSLDNGNVELIFDGLMQKEDFNLILEKFAKIKGVKVVKETEDELGKACLLSYGEFEFVLVYSSDSFVWNYVYAVKKENHKLLKKLCENFAEII